MTAETSLPNRLSSDRETTHGDFTTQALTAQALKYIMLHTPNWHDMPAYMREALELICTKLARSWSGDWKERDHYDDCIGYFTLILRGLEK